MKLILEETLIWLAVMASRLGFFPSAKPSLTPYKATGFFHVSGLTVLDDDRIEIPFKEFLGDSENTLAAVFMPGTLCDAQVDSVDAIVKRFGVLIENLQALDCFVWQVQGVRWKNRVKITKLTATADFSKLLG